MKITVVIPTFNSMKYVKDCVESILAQTYKDIEIIAYDNESTDGTYEYLLNIKDDRFEVISIPNIYPNSFLEAVLDVTSNSDSEYVTFICSDDYVDKNYILNNMNILENSEANISIQSGLIWVNENKEMVNQKTYTYESIEQFKELCLRECPVNSPTVFYHRSMWPIIMDVREAHAENNLPEIGVGDYDMWCGLADRGILIRSAPVPLGYFYRWNPDQCTWKVKKDPTNYDQIIQDYWRKKWS